jgi:beta-alanine--pyruvate transaminase
MPMPAASTAIADVPVAAELLNLDYHWIQFTPNRKFKTDPKVVVRAEGMYYWN